MTKPSRSRSYRGFLAAAFVCVTSAYANELIFTDDFETGDTSAWSKARNLTAANVNRENPFNGAYSLEIIPANGKAALQDNSPRREDDFIVTFRLNPNDLSLQELPRPRLAILRAIGGKKPWMRLAIAQLTKNRFGVELRLRQNDGRYRRLKGGTIRRNDWTEVTIFCTRAGTNGSDQGQAEIYTDGVLRTRRENLDNSEFTVDTVRFGLPAGSKGLESAVGTFYLDDFSSFRTLAP